MKQHKNIRKLYRVMLITTLVFAALGTALLCTGWALGGQNLLDLNFDKSFASGVTDVASIEADITAGYVRVCPGDGYSVTANGISEKNYSCIVEDDVMKITYDLEHTTSFITVTHNKSAPQFTITIPAGGSADIEVGTGEIKASNLDSQSLALHVGVGAIKASVLGNDSDYRIHAKVGIGNLQIPSRTFEGFGRYYCATPSDAVRSISCDAGIGMIAVDFLNAS